MPSSQRQGRRSGKGNAFVRGTEQHIIICREIGNCSGIALSQEPEFGACVEQARVEEIRTDAPRLQGKFTEAQNAVFNDEMQERFLIVFHFIRLS